MNAPDWILASRAMRDAECIQGHRRGATERKMALVPTRGVWCRRRLRLDREHAQTVHTFECQRQTHANKATANDDDIDVLLGPIIHPPMIASRPLVPSVV